MNIVIKKKILNICTVNNNIVRNGGQTHDRVVWSQTP